MKKNPASRFLFILVSLLTVHCSLYTAAYAAVGDTSVCKWKGNTKAAISLTLDDSICSQVRFAFPRLAAIGLPATFNVCPGNNGFAYYPESWENLSNRTGIQLGIHTMHHLGAANDAEWDYEIGECSRILWSLIPPGQSKLNTFVQPGAGTWNETAQGRTDTLNRYYAIESDGEDGFINNAPASASVIATLQTAMDTGKWLRYGGHGIGPEGEYSDATPVPLAIITETDFDAVFAYLDANRDKIWTGTDLTCHKYTHERSSTTISAPIVTSSLIRLTPTSTADPTLYDYPLTFITEVPSTWATGTSGPGLTVTTCCRVSQGTIYAKKIYPINVWLSSASVQYEAIPGYGEVSLEPYGMDTTPPSTPIVRDGTGASETASTSLTNQISANWDPCTDAQSGIAKYWYKIGYTSGGSELLDWIDNSTFTYFTTSRSHIALVRGVAYYVTVKAVNGAGLESTDTSSGQTVDVTPGYVGFYEDFETGDLSKWAGNDHSGQNTISVASEAKYEGNYGLKCHLVNGDNNAAVISAGNVGLGSSSFVRFRFRLSPDFTMPVITDDTGDGVLMLMRFTDEDGHPAGSMYLCKTPLFNYNRNLGIPTFNMVSYYYNNGDWAEAPGGFGSFRGPVPISTGAWHSVDVHTKAATSATSEDGGIEIWFDGVKVYSGLRALSVLKGGKDLEIGVRPTGAGISGNVYFDNISVTDSYYLPEAGAPPLTGDTIPPVLSAVPAASITPATLTSAVITWTTNESATSQVEYGTTAGYGSQTTEVSNLATSHSVTLTGLTPNTLYHYRVKSKDASSNLLTSADYTFSTVSTLNQVAGKAYPNPCDLSKGNINLTFSGNSGGEIKIYNMSGDLVKTLVCASSPVQWDGKNEAGENAARGIYLAKIKSNDGTTVTKKIAIK